MTHAERWRRSTPLFVAGAAAIVVGGLVAAVTRPTGWDDGSWVAAFLVLVMGVAQIGIGAGQAHLGTGAATSRTVLAEAMTWNLGSLGVVVGTLASSPPLVSLASLILLVALVIALLAVRESTDRWVTPYRALLVVVGASIPIGVMLSWIRS